MVTEAASVAIDQMLQEDFSHPVTRMLSWYACHLRLSSTPVTEMDVDPEPLEDDDGVRPFFQWAPLLCPVALKNVYCN